MNCIRTFLAIAACCCSTLIFSTLSYGQFTLTVESSAPAGAATPGSVYRFYVDMQDATDRMSAVFGNDQANLLVNAPGGVFNCLLYTSPSPRDRTRSRMPSSA